MIKVATIKNSIGPLTFKMTEKVILTKLMHELTDKYGQQKVMLILDYVDIIQDTVLN